MSKLISSNHKGFPVQLSVKNVREFCPHDIIRSQSQRSKPIYINRKNEEYINPFCGEILDILIISSLY